MPRTYSLADIVRYLGWFLEPENTATLGSILETVQAIEGKVDTLMAQVQVAQEDLDQLDTDLDAAASAISAKIDELAQAHPELPAGELSALRADVDTLKGLGAPASEPAPEQPPA